MILFVFGVGLYNGLVWNFFTEQLLTRKGGIYTGELARMAYLPAYAVKRENTSDLPRRHIPLAEYHGQEIGVVTVGDSFSQGTSNGPNRFYQDYIAAVNRTNVLNLSPHYPGTANFIEAIVLLVNSGYLDKVRPRHLLLERVERNCRKLGKPVDFSKTDSLENVERFYQALAAREGAVSDLPPVGFLNTGNMKWLFYNLLYTISPNAFFSKVYKVDLDRPLFSGAKQKTLLFLYKGLNKFKYDSKRLDEAKVSKMNENLNRLARLLKGKGIELWFMPVVDKYSLYRPYISDDAYPKSRSFELMRQVDREYHLIDTLEILGAEVAKGEQDIFYQDDTHWSWKASKAIFEKVRFEP